MDARSSAESARGLVSNAHFYSPSTTTSGTDVADTIVALSSAQITSRGLIGFSAEIIAPAAALALWAGWQTVAVRGFLITVVHALSPPFIINSTTTS